MELIVDKSEETSFENFYKREEKDTNNFSYWYPKVKDFFRTPHTIIVKVPVDITQSILDQKNEKQVKDWISKSLLPEIKSNFGESPACKFFIKNARYSNKFEFNTSCLCSADVEELYKHISLINYRSMETDALGFTELIIRQFIQFDDTTTPTIYNGLPLRPEYRVFYDFDKKRLLHTHDYWDYNYVSPNLHVFNDKIIFDYYQNIYKDKWTKHLNEVEDLVKSSIGGVNLKGIWSIDFLYSDCKEGFYFDQENKFLGRKSFEGIWLIDMANAYQSAYRESISEYLYDN